MENLTIETFKTKIFDFETNDEWKYLNDKPSILTFSALGWCIPCQKLHPLLKTLSEEYKDKIDIYEIDIDEQHELSEMFHIRSVPTLLFVPMDGQPQMLVGGIGKDKFKNLITEVLKIQ